MISLTVCICLSSVFLVTKEGVSWTVVIAFL